MKIRIEYADDLDGFTVHLSELPSRQDVAVILTDDELEVFALAVNAAAERCGSGIPWNLQIDWNGKEAD